MNSARQTVETQYIWKICEVPNKKGSSPCPKGGKERMSQAKPGQTGYVQAEVKSTHSKLIIPCTQTACFFQWLDRVAWPLLLHGCFFFKNFKHSRAKASENPFPLAIINDLPHAKRKQPFKGVHLLQIPPEKQEWQEGQKNHLIPMKKM